MPLRNVICLVIDGLQAGSLGAYGNTWLRTPTVDRLASEATVFDFAFVDTPDLDRLYRSFWSGRHAGACEGGGANAPVALVELLGSHGFATLLASDDSRVTAHELARSFDDKFDLEPTLQELIESPSPTAQVEDTAMARFFAQLIARVDELSGPYFVWAHCSSLGRIWDAPLDDRQSLLDDELEAEAAPSGFESISETVPPSRLLPDDFDPDELFAIRRAYGAQVQVFDRCLGGFVELLDEVEAENRPLVVLIGARGYPLGEHRRLGWPEMALHEELTHIPWMIRFPGEDLPSQRLSALVQPADLAPTLLSWCGVPQSQPGESIANGRDLLPLVTGQQESVRDRLLLQSEPSRAIRTSAWLWLQRSARDAESADRLDGELFVKPDDRWETNEIHDRCADVAAELSDRLDELSAAMLSPGQVELTALSDVAREGIH